ncbi:hypothetical protein [Azospirillum sp.]|uniref:hypothetical protein n=1 Tax=Azospirillum sp. TaxID=34012 RepID=UPI002D2785FE|nr:hypothetical protein [Azospirillum sp.]HYD66095.1 hypothetical protein [Azospirillum sp.]
MPSSFNPAAEIGKIVLKIAIDEAWKAITKKKSPEETLMEIKGIIDKLDSRVASLQVSIDKIQFTVLSQDFFNTVKDTKRIADQIENELANLAKKASGDETDYHSDEILQDHYNKYVIATRGCSFLVDSILGAMRGVSETSHFQPSTLNAYSDYLLSSATTSEVDLKQYVELMTELAGLAVNTLLRLYYIFAACEDWSHNKKENILQKPLGYSREQLIDSINKAAAEIWDNLRNAHPQAFTLYYQIYVGREQPTYYIVQKQSRHALDSTEGRDRIDGSALVMDQPAVYIDWEQAPGNTHQQWKLSAAGEYDVSISTALPSQARLGVIRYTCHYVDKVIDWQGNYKSAHKSIDRELISIAKPNDTKYNGQDDFAGRTTWRILLTPEKDYFMFKNRHMNCVLDGDASVQDKPAEGDNYGRYQRLQLYCAFPAVTPNDYKSWKLIPA